MVEIRKRITEQPLIALAALLILAALVAGGVFYTERKESEERDLILNESGEKVARAPLAESGETFKYLYDCRDDKSFTTSYDLGSNAITLTVSPEQSYVLPQDVSETGAYYTSVDGQVTFFEKAGRARVEINGEAAFESCEPSPLKGDA